MLTGSVLRGGRTARWAFTARAGGASLPPYDALNVASHVGDDPTLVRANRAALEATLAAGPIAWSGPVHGVDVALLDAPTPLVPNVDALGTARTRLPLATMGADCVPLLLAAGDLVIAAHVGWRGLVDGMTHTLATLLEERGIDAATALVLLGPAICGTCYGIPVERADRIAATCPGALQTAANGGPGADIRRGLAIEWEARGATVEFHGPCTAESASHFSHRRDGITGRQAGVIAWLD